MPFLKGGGAGNTLIVNPKSPLHDHIQGILHIMRKPSLTLVIWSSFGWRSMVVAVEPEYAHSLNSYTVFFAVEVLPLLRGNI